MNTNHLVQLSESGLRFLLIPSAKAAVLAVIAFGLTWALRKWMAPRWRHLLWLLVFARLLVPDVGAWKWSAHQWNTAGQEEAGVRVGLVGTGPDEVMTGETVMAVAPAGGDVGDFTQEAVRPDAVPAMMTGKAKPVVAPVNLNWWAVGGMVWAAGALVMLGAMAVYSLRFQRRVLGVAVPASDEWQEELAKLGERRGWGRLPELLVSSRLTSPILTGLWRPRIVLPLMVSLDALTARQRRHLLLHEMAHARRGDLWLQTAASLLLAVQWFNPLLWMAHRRLRVEAEACADAWVVRHEDHADARNYGGTLVQMVAQSASVLALFLVPGVLGMAGGGRELRERLTELALGQRRKRFWTLGALGVVVLTVATTFTRPLVAQVEAAKASLREKTDTAPGEIRGITVNQDGKPVAGVKVVLQPGDTFARYELREETTSDAEGKFQFNGLIKNQTLRLQANHSDYAYGEAVPATVGSGMEMKLVLKKGMVISGTVTDGVDGKPVAKARVYVGGFPITRYNGWNNNKYVLTDEQGRYAVTQRSLQALPALIRVESNKHATYVSEPIDASRISKPQDAALVPRKNMEGTVVDGESLPVEGALVWVAEGFISQPQVINQTWVERAAKTGENSVLNRNLSQAGGAFRLKEVNKELPANAYVMAMTPQGLGRTPLEEFLKTKTVTLLKWNTVKVMVVDEHGKPMGQTKIALDSNAQPVPLSAGVASMDRVMSATTNAQGWAIFEQVLPNSRSTLRKDTFMHAQDVVLGAGETKEVTFMVQPGVGRSEPVAGMRQVKGQVIVPPEFALSAKGVVVTIRPPDGYGRMQRALCSEEGFFVVSDVPPGRYVLTALLSDPKKKIDLIGLAGAGVEFAFANDGKKTVFEVGTLKLGPQDNQDLLASVSQEPLPMPKGPQGKVAMKMEDAEGKPVAGAEVSGYLITTDRKGLYDLEGLKKIAPTKSDAGGQVAVTFDRDQTGQAAAAALRVTVEHDDYLILRPLPLTDGETPLMKLERRPLLKVQGAAAGAQLVATFGSYGGVPVPMQADGGSFVVKATQKGLHPFLVTDQTDSRRWSFSELGAATFEPGKTVEVMTKFVPGVVIEGKVTGLTAAVPVGEAWACAEVMMDQPVEEGEVRPVSGGIGIGGRPLMRMRWLAWAPVDKDGAFFFPGVPHGKLNLQVVGPGWAMEVEPERGGVYRGRELTAADEVLHITRGAKPTLKPRLLVQTSPNGEPAVGAHVQYFRSPSRGQIGFPFRGSGKSTMHVDQTNREVYAQWMAGKTAGHQAVTGADGIATLSDVPEGTADLWVTWVDPKTQQFYRRTISLPMSQGMAEPMVVSVGPESVAELDARMRVPLR